MRAGIEARSTAGQMTAERLGDPAIMARAEDRERWAKRLKRAEPGDLGAALLGAFGRAFERWAEVA